MLHSRSKSATALAIFAIAISAFVVATASRHAEGEFASVGQHARAGAGNAHPNAAKTAGGNTSVPTASGVRFPVDAGYETPIATF